jgi:hypothetical protein
MSKLATFAVAVAALVLAFVTLSPNSAEAGPRWGGYVGPRYYRPYSYAYAYPYAYYPYWRSRAWGGWY